MPLVAISIVHPMTPSTPAQRLPAGIWVLGFVSLLMDISSEMIHSLLPMFMVGTLGMSVALVGLLEGLAEATALIVKVFSGVISDWFGKRKPLAVLGYGLGAATKPLFALAADRILGRIPKVTPSSKVVGDLALHLAAVDADPLDFEANPEHYDVPDSVVGFLLGELGEIPGGWPEPFRSKVLAGRSADIELAPVSDEDGALLDGTSAERRQALNRLLFPGPTGQFEASREQFGDLSVLSTGDYLYGLEVGAEHAVDLARGVRLYVALEAVGEPDDKGVRTVMVKVNGQLRQVFVKDESVLVDTPVAEKADRTAPGHVAAPFSGTVTVKVSVGEEVEAGQPVATIEAMKMEAAITAPIAGTVERVVFSGAQALEAGDLIAVIS